MADVKIKIITEAGDAYRELEKIGSASKAADKATLDLASAIREKIQADKDAVTENRAYQEQLKKTKSEEKALADVTKQSAREAAQIVKQEEKEKLAAKKAANKEAAQSAKDLAKAEKEAAKEAAQISKEAETNKLNKLAADFGYVGDAAKKTTGHFNAFSISGAAVASAIGNVVAMAAVKAVSSLVSLGKKAIEDADHYSELGEVFDLTADQMAGLTRTFQLAGVDETSLMSAMNNLTESMSPIASKTSVQTKAFKAMGIELQDSTGKTKSQKEILLEIADAFHTSTDAVSKDVIARNLFGRSGLKMVTVLNQGSEALAGQIDKLATASGLTAENVKGMEQLNDDLDRMKWASEGALAALGNTGLWKNILGYINEAVEGWEAIFNYMNRNADQEAIMKVINASRDFFKEVKEGSSTVLENGIYTDKLTKSYEKYLSTVKENETEEIALKDVNRSLSVTIRDMEKNYKAMTDSGKENIQTIIQTKNNIDFFKDALTQNNSRLAEMKKAQDDAEASSRKLQDSLSNAGKEDQKKKLQSIIDKINGIGSSSSSSAKTFTEKMILIQEEAKKSQEEIKKTLDESELSGSAKISAQKVAAQKIISIQTDLVKKQKYLFNENVNDLEDAEDRKRTALLDDLVSMQSWADANTTLGSGEWKSIMQSIADERVQIAETENKKIEDLKNKLADILNGVSGSKNQVLRRTVSLTVDKKDDLDLSYSEELRSIENIKSQREKSAVEYEKIAKDLYNTQIKYAEELPKKEQDEAKKAAKKQLDLSEKTVKSIKEDQKDLADYKIEVDKNYFAESKQMQAEYVNSIIYATTGLAESTADLINALGEDNKNATRAALVIQGIAAVANTYAAANQALADPTVLNYYVKVANAASAVISGLANVANINSQIQKLSTGGYVKGAQTGDKVITAMNGGELVLDKQDQNNLYAMIKNGTSGNGNFTYSPSYGSGVSSVEKRKDFRAFGKMVIAYNRKSSGKNIQGAYL